jgi:hypothetical protein
MELISCPKNSRSSKLYSINGKNRVMKRVLGDEA